MYDRMREFSEMTASGADIFMGAFSHLKNFPFFSDIDVWFAPFDESEPRVAEALGGEMASFVDMLVKMPVPCDNDKYSILLSLEATPLQQREQMGRQLEMQRAAMEQAAPPPRDIPTRAQPVVRAEPIQIFQAIRASQ